VCIEFSCCNFKIICATGKLPAGVVATQKSVVPKEKEMAICYWTWSNSGTVASVKAPRREFTASALNRP
jgi:hypothetical protein